MKKAILATQSPYKIEGVSAAFRKFFPRAIIELETISVESGVARQPFDEAVYKGARNRLKEAKKKSKNLATTTDYDYIVACESGIVKQYGNYFNLQVVVVEDASGKQAWGMSQGFQIPEKYISEIKETSLKAALDRIFNGNGGISVLSKNQFSRTELIKDATLMALSGFNWP